MLEVSFQPFPTLSTERLSLRQISMQDAESIFKLRSNPEVMKYISKPLATSIEDAKKLIQLIQDNIDNNNGINWGIYLHGSNELIGLISFWRMEKEHYRAETGYMLAPAHWRKGYLSEAMTEILKYGFETMKLHSVEANIHPGNEASRQLLIKHGFVQEAYFKENYYFDGKFEDSAIFSLLNTN